jgi:hypothetical protein
MLQEGARSSPQAVGLGWLAAPVPGEQPPPQEMWVTASCVSRVRVGISTLASNLKLQASSLEPAFPNSSPSPTPKAEVYFPCPQAFFSNLIRPAKRRRKSVGREGGCPQRLPPLINKTNHSAGSPVPTINAPAPNEPNKCCISKHLLLHFSPLSPCCESACLGMVHVGRA